MKGDSTLTESGCVEKVSTAFTAGILSVTEGKESRLVLELSKHVNKCVRYCNWTSSYGGKVNIAVFRFTGRVLCRPFYWLIVILLP